MSARSLRVPSRPVCQRTPVGSISGPLAELGKILRRDVAGWLMKSKCPFHDLARQQPSSSSIRHRESPHVSANPAAGRADRMPIMETRIDLAAAGEQIVRRRDA